MDRLACVDLPALPLQLLLRTHADWAGHPAAVVAEDKPQAPVLWVNEHARTAGVLPGMRYAAALSLTGELRAGVGADREVERAVEGLCERLQRFTPEVESCDDEPGVFWLNASGLRRLYPSLRGWVDEILSELEEQGFNSLVSIGFSKFGSYAAVKSGKGLRVLRDPAHEREVARWIPLARLNIEPGFRDALHKLGVTTLGGLIELPAAGIRERFGPEAHRLHRMAAGELWDPLQPEAIPEPTARTLLLTEPVLDTTQLLFHLKRQLHPLLAQLTGRGESLTALQLRFGMERGRDRTETIRPAAPTRDVTELTLLARLQLEPMRLTSGVLELHLEAETVSTAVVQDRLLKGGGTSAAGAPAPKRDRAAADRALAFVKAEFGDDSVVRAQLRDAHLPEARFTFEPLFRTAQPHPAANGSGPRPLVRRLFAQPEAIREPFARDPKGWLLNRSGRGTVVETAGPFVVRGGWWARELHREYHYLTTRSGEIAVAYRDRRRKRWVIQGRVE